MLEREITAAARSASLMSLPQPQSWYMDRAWFQLTRERLIEAVRAFHRKNPLLPGIPKSDLRGGELADCPLFILDALLASSSELAVEGETVRLRSHKVVYRQDEEQARAAIEGAFEKAGLATPAVAEVLARSGIENARARTLLQILLREQRLVRISEDLVIHCSAIENLRSMLASHKATRFTVSTFKDWTGISRKYAIPLLEYLDREHVTRRVGEERLVL